MKSWNPEIQLELVSLYCLHEKMCKPAAREYLESLSQPQWITGSKGQKDKHLEHTKLTSWHQRISDQKLKWILDKYKYMQRYSLKGLFSAIYMQDISSEAVLLA
jgi:hypothetical protein